jgi:hypothetical protein
VADEFISFEKVLKELQLQEAQLKKLVSEGEIRAFRDQDKMKFRKEDIERFRKKGDDLPTIEAPSGELTEELFGDDDGGGEVGMVTQQISDKSFLDEDGGVEPIELDESPRGTEAKLAAAAARPRPMKKAIVAEPATEGLGIRIALVVGTLITLFAAFVAIDAARVHPTQFSSGVRDMMADMMK